MAEAVADLERMRIAAPRIRGQHMGAHLAIEDPSGDAAIIGRHRLARPVRARNVSVPFGAPYTDGSVSPTRSPSAFWIHLDALADTGIPLRLNPRDVSLVGDETERLLAGG